MAKKNRSLINRSTLIRALELILLILLILSVLWPKRDVFWEWQEKKRTENEIVEWKEASEKYPGYRDIYLRLAVLNWKIKNDEKAKENLQKAKELDPNFEMTKEIEEIIQEE